MACVGVPVSSSICKDIVDAKSAAAVQEGLKAWYFIQSTDDDVSEGKSRVENNSDIRFSACGKFYRELDQRKTRME